MHVCKRAQLTGTLTFLNMLVPLTASINAISCGVEMMTAPEIIAC
jgi:hypothetical protein